MQPIGNIIFLGMKSLVLRNPIILEETYVAHIVIMK